MKIFAIKVFPAISHGQTFLRHHNDNKTNITRLLPMNRPRGGKGRTRDTTGEMG